MEILTECSKMLAINFAEWLNDNHWIKDPFPRKEFDDDIIRYSNIADVDICEDEKLITYTINELYDKFIETEKKRINEKYKNL